MAPAATDCGVTLLELLIALAIAAILAAMAYPSYRQHLIRAHRTEAIESLLAVAAEQERHHLAHGRYAEDFRADDEAGLVIAPITATGMYRLDLAEAGPASFLAVATPVAGGPQAADRRCARFTMHANGRRSAFDDEGRDTTRECWR